ncbi:hypothetical protein IQ241_06890 [Romeria aff. gracilis LEGE 07310]|uniref:Uncharacterized protein n=1 Tax=Vasconcelosia minhoensis LEGE 07310 TaxID=915328 RepID=A0A8J7AC98_9CYAN|nr:hypothetical protein [Romeria gracilis]MBE9077024.1 hypothetical protein [Romeria aff. gracilis LEGE 07310]
MDSAMVAALCASDDGILYLLQKRIYTRAFPQQLIDIGLIARGYLS